MPLSYAQGAVQWLTADAATTVYTISGLSFQPKILIFYWNGLQSNSPTSAGSTAVNSRRGIGFAVSTSSRRAVSSFSQDAAAAAVCGTAVSNDCVACTIDGAAARTGLLDIDTITSDGFTLIVDDAAPVNLTVFWEAFGGDDITVAEIGDITEPAATGNVDYTVTGFASDATDQVVMFAGVQSTAALNTAVADDSGMYVGFATSGSVENNIVVAGNSDDGSPAMDTDGYGLSGECLAMITVGGGNPNARAQLTQFGTDNFRLNWIARGVTGRRSVFLAVKGGQWAVGALTIDASTLNATTTESGLVFNPNGLMCISRLNIEQTAGTAAADDTISIGSAWNVFSSHAMSETDTDAVTDSAIGTALNYSAVAVARQNGIVIDVLQVNADGFRLIVEANTGGVANTWIGYLAFASARQLGTERPTNRHPGIGPSVVAKLQTLAMAFEEEPVVDFGLGWLVNTFLSQQRQQSNQQSNWFVGINVPEEVQFNQVVQGFLSSSKRQKNRQRDWFTGPTPRATNPIEWILPAFSFENDRRENRIREWFTSPIPAATNPIEWILPVWTFESARRENRARDFFTSQTPYATNPIEWIVPAWIFENKRRENRQRDFFAGPTPAATNAIQWILPAWGFDKRWRENRAREWFVAKNPESTEALMWLPDYPTPLPVVLRQYPSGLLGVQVPTAETLRFIQTTLPDEQRVLKNLQVQRLVNETITPDVIEFIQTEFPDRVSLRDLRQDTNFELIVSEIQQQIFVLVQGIDRQEREVSRGVDFAPWFELVPATEGILPAFPIDTSQIRRLVNRPSTGGTLVIPSVVAEVQSWLQQQIAFQRQERNQTVGGMSLPEDVVLSQFPFGQMPSQRMLARWNPVDETIEIWTLTPAGAGRLVRRIRRSAAGGVRGGPGLGGAR